MHRRSLLTLGAAALTAGPALADPPLPGEHPIVMGTSYVLPSTVLGEDRRVNVWLPASYGQGQARYPVLYLLDGGEEEDFHHISGLANISGAYGVTREFIVVGVESGPRRRYHMTWPSEVADELKAIPVNGGASEYRLFLANEVFPWVENRYRASSERVLMGESLGGLFVIDTLLRQPRMFAGYIAIDPSLWWGKGALVRDASLEGWKALEPKRRVFVALSSQGPKAEGALLREGLQAGAALDYRLMEDETHASIYHPAATRAFRTIFASPPAPSAP